MENVRIVPTVGRMVYFKYRGSADGVFPARDFAAIITRVYTDTKVSLVSFSERRLRFEIEVEQGQEGGQWDWMPYQKGQAKTTEELEKTVSALKSNTQGSSSV